MQEEQHFKMIFWLAVGTVATGFAYMFLVSFFHVPSPNLDFVKSIIPWMQGGAVGVVMGFVFAGSTPKKNVP